MRLLLEDHDQQGNGHRLECQCYKQVNLEKIGSRSAEIAQEKRRQHEDLDDAGEKLADGKVGDALLVAAADFNKNLLGDCLQSCDAGGVWGGGGRGGGAGGVLPVGGGGGGSWG